MNKPSTDDPWNADLYRSQHNFVFEYGRGLTDIMPLNPGDQLLDLGCGTGELTNALAQRGADVLGVDRSPAMIEQARHEYPNVRFEVRDIYDLGFTACFDGVFSNAVLHWVTRPDPALQAIARSLRPRGHLLVELGGLGNIHQVVDSLAQALTSSGQSDRVANNPWFFPSVGDYCSRLESVGFRVESAIAFERPTRLEGPQGIHAWYRMFATAFLDGLEPQVQTSIINHAAEIARPTLYREGAWYADYVRLRISARKVQQPPYVQDERPLQPERS